VLGYHTSEVEHMNQVPGGGLEGAERARRWWLRQRLWDEEVQEALLPAVGATVGGYHLEAKLGRGGQGTVYRARRNGRLYAVKFIYLPVVGARAHTEVEVLPRLEKSGVVGYGSTSRMMERPRARNSSSWCTRPRGRRTCRCTASPAPPRSVARRPPRSGRSASSARWSWRAPRRVVKGPGREASSACAPRD
jgi:hypothetical protein